MLQTSSIRFASKSLLCSVLMSWSFSVTAEHGQQNDHRSDQKNSQAGWTIAYFLEDGQQVSRDSVSLAVASARVCGEKAEELSKVELFMPDHGHGSAPTRLRASEVPGCVEVEDIFFSMPGFWELRAKVDGEVEHVFEVDVSRA